MKVEFSKKLIQPQNQFTKICGIAWSPNNKRLAIACEDKNIYLLDEQGNHKENFSTKISDSKTYEIIQIIFNPESTKLAIAQSDNSIIIYDLELNLSNKNLIYNKLELKAKPKCIVWSKINTKDIIIGLSDGEIMTGLVDNKISKFLYSHQSPCISISSSFDGKYIISGHKDTSILIFNSETSIAQKLFHHSCPPTCLAWGKDSNILAAGNDYKVIIYDNSGKNIQNFDYTNDDNVKEFGCYAISYFGDAIALGNADSIYIYFFNDKKQKWENSVTKIENYYLITALCWKPDRSALVTGNLISSVDLFEAYLSKKIYKDIFEIMFITNNLIKITNKQTQT
jgi:intraflagellar transport protein 172